MAYFLFFLDSMLIAFYLPGLFSIPLVMVAFKHSSFPLVQQIFLYCSSILNLMVFAKQQFIQQLYSLGLFWFWRVLVSNR